MSIEVTHAEIDARGTAVPTALSASPHFLPSGPFWIGFSLSLLK